MYLLLQKLFYVLLKLFYVLQKNIFFFNINNLYLLYEESVRKWRR